MTDSDLHRIVLEHADAITNSRASELLDVDSYLLAMMQLVLTGIIPCDLPVLARLHALAVIDGYC